VAGYALPIGGALTFTARQDRQARAALLQPGASGLQVAPGVRPGPGLDVSVAGSTITVTPGAAIVQSAASATAGAYQAFLDANATLALTAADGSNPRADLVYLRVRDTDEDGSGFRDCAPVYLAGTPAASPLIPTIPVGTSGIILGVINVPKSGSGSPTVSTTTRQISVAAGGVQPLFDPTALAVAGLFTGQVRYNGVRGLIEYWNGAAWTAQGDWTTYTVAWTSTGTAPVAGNGTFAGRWTRIGRTIHVEQYILFGSTSNAGTGEWRFSLPVAAAALGAGTRAWVGSALGTNPSTAYWPGNAVVEGGASVLSVIGPTSAAGSSNSRWGATVPFTWSNTHYLSLSATYEAAT
jgi:hypothetical protein